MVLNKVSAQFQKGPQQYADMIRAPVTSFKFLGLALNEGLIGDVPKDKLVIFRRAGGDEDFTRDPGNEGIAWANETFDRLTPYLKIRPDAIVETINEPNPTVTLPGNILDRAASIVLAQKLNIYQVACADRLHQLGVQNVGAYQFSGGQPPCRAFNGDNTLWPYLLDGIRHSDYLLLHEYSAPRMTDGQGANCLRYRHVLAELATFGVHPLVGITETGIDRGMIDGKLGGYRDLDNHTTIYDYCHDLEGYATELAKDDAVKFAHVFLAGRSSDQWLTFDVADDDSDRARFIQFLNWQPPVVNPMPPSFAFDAYPLPQAYPVRQGFGVNPAIYLPLFPGHEGIDLAAPIGVPVRAVAAGQVIESVNAGAYGLHVRVQHANGWQTIYAHLSEAVLGGAVRAGDSIGKSGNTGNVTGPHLHLTLCCLGFTYIDANGVSWPRNVFDPTSRLLAVTPPTGETMTTQDEILAASWKSMGITYNTKEVTAFVAKSRLLFLDGPAGNEYTRVDSETGKTMAGQCFHPGVILETVQGDWAMDSIKPLKQLTALPWTPPGPVIVPGGIPRFDPTKAIAPIYLEETQPLTGLPFYRVQGMTVLEGDGAYCYVTVLGKDGAAQIGVKVVNQWLGSVNGECVLTDGTGIARFQFGSGSSVPDPATGHYPFSFAITKDGFKDYDAKVLHVGTIISDWTRGVGDFQAEHTQIVIQYRQVQ